LSSYVKEVSVGDVLTVRALVTNPLDWQHFYEMLSALHHGDKTDFTVVTREGDRVVGDGEVAGFEKWSDRGRYGFMIKVSVKRQKSLTDRRVRGTKTKSQVVPEIAAAAAEGKEVMPGTKESEVSEVKQQPTVAASTAAAATVALTSKDMSDFKDLLKDSLTMDMSA
jgi:hypothetical protein